MCVCVCVIACVCACVCVSDSVCRAELLGSFSFPAKMTPIITSNKNSYSYTGKHDYIILKVTTLNA